MFCEAFQSANMSSSHRFESVTTRKFLALGHASRCIYRHSQAHYVRDARKAVSRCERRYRATARRFGRALVEGGSWKVWTWRARMRALQELVYELEDMRDSTPGFLQHLEIEVGNELRKGFARLRAVHARGRRYCLGVSGILANKRP